MAYDSTKWSTDSKTKATLSATTNDNYNITGTLAVTGVTTLSSILNVGANSYMAINKMILQYLLVI